MKNMMLILCLVLASLVFAQPYQPHAIWSREGAGDSSLYGSQILALGDQNNDGYNDWAVYAAGWGPPGQICEPKVEFFHGGSPPDSVPYMTRITQTPEEHYIWNARTLGDLNGDGYVDWAVITELTADSLHRDIYKIYFGGPGTHDQPDLILHSMLVRPAGDANGDGYADLWGIIEPDEYHPRLWYGGSPFDTLPDWTHAGYFGGVYPGEVNGDRFSDFVVLSTDDNVDLYLGGNPPDTIPAYHWDEYIGYPAILPDVNGDGIGDLAFSVAGGVEIRFGGSAIHSTPDEFLHFPGCSPTQGVFSAGDFNHDGYYDVAMVTDFCADSWYGKLAVHLGGQWLNPEPAFVIEGWTDPFNLIGIRTVADLGDVNGDGVEDLGIGANSDVAHDAWRGKVVILGGDSSLRAGASQPNAVLPQNLQVTAYPNPFNSTTRIRFDLVKREHVKIDLYDLQGRLVRTLVDEIKEAGRQEIAFSAEALASGTYFVRLKTAEAARTEKILLLK